MFDASIKRVTVDAHDTPLDVGTKTRTVVHEGGFRLAGTAADLRFERPGHTSDPAANRLAGSRAAARAPTQGPCMARPDYQWAIGAAM